VWHIFPSVVHFAKCAKRGAFFQVLRISPSVAHFSNSDAFSQVWRFFLKCSAFSNSGAFFQVRHIFPTVAHFFKCGAFFQQWRIFLQVWRIFSSVPHFSK